MPSSAGFLVVYACIWIQNKNAHNCGIRRNATRSKRKRCWFRGSRLGELPAAILLTASFQCWTLRQQKVHKWLYNTSQYKVLSHKSPCSRYFNGNVVCTTWQAVNGGDLEFRQSKAFLRLPNTSQYKLCSIFAIVWPEFQCQQSGRPSCTPHFAELG